MLGQLQEMQKMLLDWHLEQQIMLKKKNLIDKTLINKAFVMKTFLENFFYEGLNESHLRYWKS